MEGHGLYSPSRNALNLDDGHGLIRKKHLAYAIGRHAGKGQREENEERGDEDFALFGHCGPSSQVAVMLRLSPDHSRVKEAIGARVGKKRSVVMLICRGRDVYHAISKYIYGEYVVLRQSWADKLFNATILVFGNPFAPGINANTVNDQMMTVCAIEGKGEFGAEFPALLNDGRFERLRLGKAGQGQEEKNGADHSDARRPIGHFIDHIKALRGVRFGDFGKVEGQNAHGLTRIIFKRFAIYARTKAGNAMRKVIRAAKHCKGNPLLFDPKHMVGLHFAPEHIAFPRNGGTRKKTGEDGGIVEHDNGPF